ncbi:alpha/beta hydrolase [Bacillus shivajii]|uniref:alpha/beta hydrolase n=1 Tax=Bacillus shivajii TaxID=1983719 RepID=UPI001CF96B78|nr:alpha/beta hydrolase [Bacillus shivajii]UCZ53917.1 alpha/beta hydrolase [Bacillus shivajii]
MNSSQTYEKRKAHFFIMALVASNILSILLGIAYLVINDYHKMWNIYGGGFLFTLLFNIIVTLYKSGIRGMDYLYLLFTIVAMITIPIMNKRASIDISNMSSQSVVSITLIFSLFALGAVVSILKLRDKTNGKYKRNSRMKNATKTVLKVECLIALSIFLLLGVYLSYQLLRGKSGNFIEMGLPQHSLFLSFIFLAASVLMLNMFSSKTSLFLKIFISTIGIALTVIFSLPLVTTLFAIDDVEAHYIKAFDQKTENIIPEDKHINVSNIHFSLPKYFFGTPSGEYRVMEDVLFYEGKAGVDKGISLHFDAYLPPENRTDLPGNNSVLLRIHGGGWTAGDKGSLNNIQVSKHFASQGYVVFDVQHGLSHEEKFFKFLSVPGHTVAGFTIDDMVRHIGIFTDFLVENHDTFDANLDSVFISGSSAGGQLANAVGLGIATGKYNDLNPNVHVKGIIPIYPANGLAPLLGIEGEEELSEPALLVDENSPPALIFQGTHDGLVDESISKKFDQTYDENGSGNAALILMPFAGHASNSYFSGYYNQLFMYYMERFMYQFQEG